MSSPSQRTEFYLFGHQISHSASPAFHNEIFSALGLSQHRYQLHDTKHPQNDPNSRMIELIRRDDFGGASVTMPIKVEAMKHVDKIAGEAKEIGSINTIVVESIDKDGRPVLLGCNTDWIGMCKSLLLALPTSQQALKAPFSPSSSPSPKSGFIIGGGGTTRAAVIALSRLQISPIFLINRDPTETAVMIKSFPQYDLRALDHVDQWSEEWVERGVVGVGAIPSLEPVTEGEKNVYTVARKVFGSKPTGQVGQRTFLEMCYKPRKTIMYNIAVDAGWHGVQGVESMIQQGYEQSRAWLLSSAASPFQGQRKELGEVIEHRAAAFVRGMEDIEPVGQDSKATSPSSVKLAPQTGARFGQARL
ncbi:BZ3500_MvSof-1268-A1-R1_Chr8-2g10166 [Microbotryum saponariae]|uniref:BZ3500_MvSof-1268-A1-R1_Chr8-2g10166 protein n=1 Tax=Microbotryum saponariae TaxID=289078 RepID=A0A2X0KX12_9BASI|nr:BZ3500_MvSof-1268-A1-R1_Chr8-2g10166 [Microbotryum saponariae]SDA01919.1 BZ3501_MvSof-1269-A2-R1_Chr8-2g09917 [Microbotryum saponariae]